MKQLLLIFVFVLAGCAEKQATKIDFHPLEKQELSEQQINAIQKFIYEHQISSENIPTFLSVLGIPPENASLFQSPSQQRFYYQPDSTLMDLEIQQQIQHDELMRQQQEFMRQQQELMRELEKIHKWQEWEDYRRTYHLPPDW